MAITNWWQETTPHKDIIEGQFDEAIFAADLGDVVNQKGPAEYQHGDLFFDKTYLTKGLEQLFTTVLLRLCGSGKGESVIQLQTPFGGGKTHALLGLYHLIKNGNKLTHTSTVEYLLGVSGLDKIPAARVAAFIGTHADPLKGRTPWGEIAYQLDAYELIKEHDAKRVAPGKERLREVFIKSGPTLILIDELLEYIVKANRVEKTEKITRGQTLAFLQEISELIGTLKDSVLVISLPSSALEQYDEEAERALTQLKKVCGRVESIYTPVEGVEIYEIIRKRLFEDLGSEKNRKQVALWYYNLYRNLSDDIPNEMRNVEYRDRIEHAYPFHPEVIDLLYERWGSLPTFQRTRGVLRLLAEVLEHLYKSKAHGALIHSSLIPLGIQSVRREFIKHIGDEFDSIISADIAGKGAKCPQIDKQMGSEYAKYNIAKGLATSVFLHSFSGGERKGVNLKELRVSILSEGIPKTIVGDAVKKLEDELWYFHSSTGVYSFRNQANLNRVIVDSEEHVSDNNVNDFLLTSVQKAAGTDFDVYIWPESSSDVPDTRKIKLVILSPFDSYPGKNCENFIEELYSKAGSGFRVYKNGLFVLAVDENASSNLKKLAKRIIALEKIQKNKDLIATLTKNSIAELSIKAKDAKSNMSFMLHSACRNLAYLTSEGVRWVDLGLPTFGSISSFSSRVKDYLEEEELLLPHISPQVIMRHTKLRDEDEKRIGDIFEMYLKTPGLPFLMNQEVLFGGIRKGVREGIFGVKTNGVSKIGETLFEINSEMSIVGKKLAEKLKPGYELKGDEVTSRPAGEVKEEEKERAKEKETNVKLLSVSAEVSWDKLSQFISGVIGPLKEKNAQLHIKIDLKASSESGFDRTTLDSRVKETLQQIGAQIDIWQED